MQQYLMRRLLIILSIVPLALGKAWLVIAILDTVANHRSTGDSPPWPVALLATAVLLLIVTLVSDVVVVHGLTDGWPPRWWELSRWKVLAIFSGILNAIIALMGLFAILFWHKDLLESKRDILAFGIVELAPWIYFVALRSLWFALDSKKRLRVSTT